MRLKERIPIFFELVNWDKLSKRWGLKGNISNHVLNHAPYINVSKYWLKNPDQRIGQVLINLNLIPDNFQIWYDEESDILKDQGIEPREFLVWGCNYDKDMNLLPEIKYRLIKDLDTDYIINILSMFDAPQNTHKLNSLYKETFVKELKIRNEETDNTQESGTVQRKS